MFQFDPTGRFMLGMRIFIEGRKVQPLDKWEMGYFDLQNKNQWTLLKSESGKWI